MIKQTNKIIAKSLLLSKGPTEPTYQALAMQYENVLSQILRMTEGNAELSAMIRDALKSNGLGFLNQNNPPRYDNESKPRAPTSNNPIGDPTDLSGISGNSYSIQTNPQHPNGPTLEQNRLPNPRTNNPANVNASIDTQIQKFKKDNTMGDLIRLSENGQLLKSADDPIITKKSNPKLRSMFRINDLGEWS